MHLYEVASANQRNRLIAFVSLEYDVVKFSTINTVEDTRIIGSLLIWNIAIFGRAVYCLFQGKFCIDSGGNPLWLWFFKEFLKYGSGRLEWGPNFSRKV